MKKLVFVFIIALLCICSTVAVKAQCSICTKTASQLGEKQGRGLNSGIIYLMFTPLAIGGIIGYRWWKSEKSLKEGNSPK